jgi:hypothetical protein
MPVITSNDIKAASKLVNPQANLAEEEMQGS